MYGLFYKRQYVRIKEFNLLYAVESNKPKNKTHCLVQLDFSTYTYIFNIWHMNINNL